MNMNEFEKNYIDMTDSTMPDMEKLWERIESSQPADEDISAFEAASESVSGSSKKSITVIRGISSVAAVFAAVFCLSFAIGKTDEKQMTNYSDMAPAAEENIAYADEAADSCEETLISAVTEWDFSDSVTDSESYSTLDLAASESAVYTALSRNNEENEYFVEAAVLRETDYFLDCTVAAEEQYSDDTIIYTVDVIRLIGDEGTEVSETVQIYSSSPYALRSGREYLIPISEDNGRMNIVFDDAPQIEITRNRELVCHNGWSSLTKNSSFIEYPQVYEDDYFYDRMTLTAESSVKDLIESWQRER